MRSERMDIQRQNDLNNISEFCCHKFMWFKIISFTVYNINAITKKQPAQYWIANVIFFHVEGILFLRKKKIAEKNTQILKKKKENSKKTSFSA